MDDCGRHHHRGCKQRGNQTRKATRVRSQHTRSSFDQLVERVLYWGTSLSKVLPRFLTSRSSCITMSPTKSTFAHSRQNSHESEGSSYQLILEHILSYPDTYEVPLRGTHELPLRTMYTLNCHGAPRTSSQHPSRAPSPTSNSSSPKTPNFPHDQKSTTAQFTSALMDQISQLPSHPSSLPPSFVTSFVNRCFPVELEVVDFPQSLTALDYLKDLETRRRKEIAHSFRTLNLDQSNLNSEKMHDLRSWNPAVADWVESLEAKLRRVDALYSNVYISLRRWV